MAAVVKKVPCDICETELTLSGRANHHCQTEACVTAYAHRRAVERVVRVGDCEVWQGSVHRKGRTPIVTLRFNNKRRDFRVLALRDPDSARAVCRRYIRSCGTDKCVTVEHHRIQIGRSLPPTKTIYNRLPWEPLAEWIKDRNIVIGNGNGHVLSQARDRGFITVTRADEFCIDVLGVHPAAVYGDLFFEA